LEIPCIAAVADTCDGSDVIAVIDGESPRGLK
jgi:hypothetical protein